MGGTPTDQGDPDGDPADATGQEWGSDFVVELIDELGFEFVSFNPGASFRGLEESIVNYNDNAPRVITTPNEGLSVAIAHGYAKATGEPGLCILHNVVGTLNAHMAIFNAYIDRVPILMLSGTGPMRKSQRRPWIDWIHTAHLQGNLVRDTVKWDSQPVHIDGVADSLLRANEIAQTAPKGPTYVTIDHEIQEQPLEEPVPVPDPGDYPQPTRMAPEAEAIDAAADALVGAEMPVFLVDLAGDSREAVEALVDLTERLGAPVLDIRWRRFNFPNTHPMSLSESDVYEHADVLVALDVWDREWITGDWSTSVREAIGDDFTYVEIGTHELGASGLFPNTYAVHPTDVPILADTALAVPALRDAVTERLDRDEGARSRAEERYGALADRHRDQREQWRAEAEAHWEDDPISPARLAGELWNVIDGSEWVLVNDMSAPWTRRLWEVEEFDQYIGGYSGGAGLGYGIGAAIGAALAVEGSGRIPINIQTDGALMQYLSGLWILGRYEIPLFTVMHNNRALYNSTNHRQELARRRGRDDGFDRALVGTGLDEPAPDYAAIADALGVRGYGPVEDPDELPAVLEEAWEAVQGGSPVLVDVVSGHR